MIDFEVQRCTRRCARTGRDLSPGEVCYSALVQEGAQITRLDFAEAAWEGPPENSIGWWRSKIPETQSTRAAWAPNDVLLDYFHQLEGDPQRADELYVLALLLVRRRLLRLEDTVQDASGNEVLTLFSPRTETQHHVTALLPDEARIAQIQADLKRLFEGEITPTAHAPPASPEPPAPPDSELVPLTDQAIDATLAAASAAELAVINSGLLDPLDPLEPPNDSVEATSPAPENTSNESVEADEASTNDTELVGDAAVEDDDNGADDNDSKDEVVEDAKDQVESDRNDCENDESENDESEDDESEDDESEDDEGENESEDESDESDENDENDENDDESKDDDEEDRGAGDRASGS